MARTRANASGTSMIDSGTRMNEAHALLKDGIFDTEAMPVVPMRLGLQVSVREFHFLSYLAALWFLGYRRAFLIGPGPSSQCLLSRHRC